MLKSNLLGSIGAWWNRKTRTDAVLVIIVLIFFAGMLPVAASRIIDTLNFERYYTDGTVAMLQANDFLTPRQGDGTLRFRKPPFIYWILMACYKLMGVSFFSSRIFFLVTGCATIWLAYALALKLTDDIRAARATALILLPNLLLIMVAARSTPDILVTFWILASAFGFIRLICYNDTRALSYWSAYGGAAIAVATKGLLPIVFVVYALTFAYWTSSAQQPFRRVLHAGIILASIAVSCSGIFLMAWKHGMPFLQSFWGDQFAEKTGLGGSPWRVTVYFLTYVAFFLPWLPCLAYLFYKQKPEKPVTAIQRKTCLFVLIWAALLAIIFGLGDRVAVRYLLPAVPLLAVVMAIGLGRFSDSAIAIVADQLLNAVTIGFFAIAIFGLSVLWQAGLLGTHFAGFTILFLALLIFALRWQRKQLSSQGVLSVSLFLVLPLCLAIVSPFTLPDQTTQVARALRELNPEKRPVYVIGTNKLGSRLRISSGNAYVVYEADAADLLQAPSRASSSVFVLSENEARHLPANSFQLREIAAYPMKVSLPKLFAATLRREAKAYLERKKNHCYAVLGPSTSNNNH